MMEVHMNRNYTQLDVWQSMRLWETGNLMVIDGINRKQKFGQKLVKYTTEASL